MLCIPVHLAIQLNLTHESAREAAVADSRSMRFPYVGALALGNTALVENTVLLGAVPMEVMDLTIYPSLQRLEPDPPSPDIAQALVMGLG